MKGSFLERVGMKRKFIRYVGTFGCPVILTLLLTVTAAATPPRRRLRAAVPADAFGQQSGPDDAGVDIQTAAKASTAAKGCAEHPHHPDRQ